MGVPWGDNFKYTGCIVEIRGRKTMQLNKIKSADVAEKLVDGDEITVQYKSAHGGTQEFHGVVDSVNDHNGVGMVDVFVRSDADPDNRRDCYTGNGDTDRKVEFMMDHVTVYNRNGYRWNKLNETGTDPVVKNQ